MPGRKSVEYHESESIARELLTRHHPALTLPIPIERIVEIDLGIAIVPIPGLSRILHSQEGALLRNRAEIIVDAGQVDDYTWRENPRYLFTLAHELGHYILHEDFYRDAVFASTDEYKQWYLNTDPREIDRLELEANNFAGQVLLPGAPLLEVCTAIIEEYALILGGIDQERIWSYVGVKVARHFGVSELCAHHRIRLARRYGPLDLLRWR